MRLPTLEESRGLFELVAIGAALISVQLTGNYFKIRWYLFAQLVCTFCLEILLACGFERESAIYRGTYFTLSAPVLFCTAVIAWRLVRNIPDQLRPHYIAVPAILAIVAAYLTPASNPISLYLLFNACVLLVTGTQTRAAAELIENPAERAPHRTLGLLWVVQSMIFFLYASGVNIYPKGWEEIGGWLPAIVGILGIGKLSWDFLTEGRHEQAVTKLRAQ